jgi:hypothetical protein
MMMRRRCASPVFVIAPRRIRGHWNPRSPAPRYTHQLTRPGKRASAPASATIHRRDLRDPAEGLEGANHGLHLGRGGRDGLVDGPLEPVEAIGDVLDLCD